MESHGDTQWGDSWSSFTWTTNWEANIQSIEFRWKGPPGVDSRPGMGMGKTIMELAMVGLNRSHGNTLPLEQTYTVCWTYITAVQFFMIRIHLLSSLPQKKHWIAAQGVWTYLGGFGEQLEKGQVSAVNVGAPNWMWAQLMIGLLKVTWGSAGRSIVFSGWILNRWMHLIGCKSWVQYALNIRLWITCHHSNSLHPTSQGFNVTQPKLSKPTAVDEQTPKQSAQHLHFKDTRQMLREELATNGANSKSDMPLPHLSSSKDFTS